MFDRNAQHDDVIWLGLQAVYMTTAQKRALVDPSTGAPRFESAAVAAAARANKFPKPPPVTVYSTNVYP